MNKQHFLSINNILSLLFLFFRIASPHSCYIFFGGKSSQISTCSLLRLLLRGATFLLLKICILKVVDIVPRIHNSEKTTPEMRDGVVQRFCLLAYALDRIHCISYNEERYQLTVVFMLKFKVNYISETQSCDVLAPLIRVRFSRGITLLFIRKALLLSSFPVKNRYVLFLTLICTDSHFKS